MENPVLDGPKLSQMLIKKLNGPKQKKNKLKIGTKQVQT